MNLIFLDTEATGNDTKSDHLCQVCYKTPSGFNTEYFKPPIPISIKAMSITHITNDMVNDKGQFKGSQYAKDLQDILNNSILVAHNASFDVELLKKEGIEIPKYICTLKLARFLDEEASIPEYNQQFLRYYYNLKFDDVIVPHDAESDVKVLEALYKKLEEIFIKKFGETGKEEKMIDISSKPMLVKTFTFGKYKGEMVDRIAVNDRGYLEWLLNAKKQNPDGEEDWIYTLEYYLK